MKKLILLPLAILFIQNCFGQNYDPKKISSTATAILFSKSEMRGFTYDGTIYYVKDDLQTVVAIKNDNVLWEKNITQECKKNTTTNTKIKMFKVSKGELHASCGNREIVIALDGKVNCGK